MKKLIKNKKLLFGIIIGLVLGVSITGVVAYSVYANKVTYDNTQSGLQSTDVQGAIDELYTKVAKDLELSVISVKSISAGVNTTTFNCQKGDLILVANFWGTQFSATGATLVSTNASPKYPNTGINSWANLYIATSTTVTISENGDKLGYEYAIIRPS